MNLNKPIGKHHSKSMLEGFAECPLKICSDRLENYQCYTKDYENCPFYKAYMTQLESNTVRNS